MSETLTGHQVGESAYAEYSQIQFNPNDPSPWQALYLDRSLPMDVYAKAAYLKNLSSWSRQYLLAVVRPFCHATILLVQLLKIFIPNAIYFSKTLHYLIYIGQKYFVSPEANYIILRHFHLGSQILRFLATNVENCKIDLKSIRPVELKEIYTDEIYLNHDLNLFNFIIQLNESMRQSKKRMRVKETLDFSMIEQGDFQIKGLRNTWLNFLDIETAIELYTPVFQFLLRDSDFWRAHHSLQFDETIAIYVAQVLKNPHHLGLVNNRHPLAPLSGRGAAYRLVLHGVSTELLHGMLAQRKRVGDNPEHDWQIPLEYDIS